jgi:hypothetical protein
MKQIIHDGVSTASNYNDVSWAINTQLTSFALLVNIVRHIIIKEQKRIKEMEVVTSAGNPNDVMDEDEDDEDDEDEDEEEDEDEDDEDDDIHMFDFDELDELDDEDEDDEDEDEGLNVDMDREDKMEIDINRQTFIKDSLEKYKNRLMRTHNPVMNGNVETRDSESDNGEVEVLKVSPDNVKEYVSIIKKNGYIIIILNLTNEMLTYSKINEVFHDLYQNLNEGGSKKEGKDCKKTMKNREMILKFTRGLTFKDFQTSYKKLMQHLGLKSEYNTTITDITQMFKITNVYHTLVFNNEFNLVQKLFFLSRYNQSLNSFKTKLSRFSHNLLGRNHVDYMNLGASTYMIPIEEFNYEGIERRLLPWIDPVLWDFFLNSNESPDNLYSQSYLSNIKREFFQNETIKMMSDPVEYLASYVENIKRENNGSLTRDQKIFLLKLLGYVTENPKLYRNYSEYNKAMIRRIVETRTRYGGFKLIGRVLKISQNSDIPIMRMNGRFGPLSELLWFSSNILREYHTIPKEHLSFVGLLPLIVGPNCCDRKDGHHFHIQSVGRTGSGKDELYKMVEKLLPGRISLSISSFSDQAFSTDEPQNDGIVFMNDPNPLYTEKESKIGFNERKKLAELKGILSSGEFIRQVNEYIKEPGKRARRKMRLSITPISICILTSVNHVKNREEALGSRFFFKSVFKYKNSALVKNIIKRSEIRNFSKILERNYHDIVIIQRILTRAITIGILEKQTIGIGANILRLVLKDLESDGLTNTDEGRNFGRIMMVFNQLINASAIIKRYLQQDRVVEFNYEDLVDIEPDLSLTKEVLFITTNYLIEQYANPTKSIFVSTFFDKFSTVDKSNFILSDEEVRRIETYLQENIVTEQRKRQRRQSNIITPPKKKKRKINNNWDFQQNIPLSFDIKYKPKRKRFSPPISSRKRKKRKRKRESCETGDCNCIECRNTTRSEENNAELKRERVFEITIRRLDKIFPLIDESKHKFVMRKIDHDEHGQQLLFDLNCIELETRTRLKDIVDIVWYRMPVIPAKDEVYTVYFDLQKEKHYVPIWFNTISVQTYQTIKNLYAENKSKNVRLDTLRSIFQNNYKYNILKPLIKVFPPDKNSDKKVTTIVITPFLLNTIDPSIINKRIRSKIENYKTKRQTIFCPKLTMNPEHQSSQNDFEFITIKPNNSIKRLKFKNPGYIEENIAISCLKSNDILSRRIDSITTPTPTTVPRILTIEDHPAYHEEVELYKGKYFIINCDFDDFLRKQRKNVLRL